jgi:hypothetical protein
MSDEIQRAMGRVEAKIDLLLGRSDAHDQRISAVEKKVWYGSGVAAVMTFIATKFFGGGHA